MRAPLRRAIRRRRRRLERAALIIIIELHQNKSSGLILLLLGCHCLATSWVWIFLAPLLRSALRFRPMGVRSCLPPTLVRHSLGLARNSVHRLKSDPRPSMLGPDQVGTRSGPMSNGAPGSSACRRAGASSLPLLFARWLQDDLRRQFRTRARTRRRHLAEWASGARLRGHQSLSRASLSCSLVLLAL